MDSSLSPELRALCELASQEHDSHKLLELAKRIDDALEQREQENRKPTKSSGTSGTSNAA